jgi:hypothetical protein
MPVSVLSKGDIFVSYNNDRTNTKRLPVLQKLLNLAFDRDDRDSPLTAKYRRDAQLVEGLAIRESGCQHRLNTEVASSQKASEKDIC